MISVQTHRRAFGEGDSSIKETWCDLTPSMRCDWLDQLRGWAVILMIEVHVVNVWLNVGLLPRWLNFVNGLVAPSFIMCAGYSLVLSTFKSDGTMRPLVPTMKRLGFILLCAYALHMPGFTLAEWTVRSTSARWRDFFQIDVLQCIVFSLLILHGLARIIRRPMVYAAVALILALIVALASPALWHPGVAAGWWLPVRGLVNGNTDRGVTSLFPLFPWFAFAAFGSVLGAIYRYYRILSNNGKARWSELHWLVTLVIAGGISYLWGSQHAKEWLSGSVFPTNDIGRLYNTTLPSVAERLGLVCVAGALMGWIELLRGRWTGPNLAVVASRESLLLYMLHLNLIFGVLLADPLRRRMGWECNSLGWLGTLGLTLLIIGANLAVGVAWQRIRKDEALVGRIQKSALIMLAIWFVVGGWSASCY